MTPKENLMETINWGHPEYVPMTAESIAIVGWRCFEGLEYCAAADGYDGFGVHWVVNAAGYMHDTSQLLLEDVSEWRDKVHFPDLDQVDFAEAARMELETIDRSQKAVAFYGESGINERLVSLIGWENLLCALITDPEEVMAFYDAMADWKIKEFQKINETYKPDIYVYFDEMSAANGLLISPETYRKVIKPAAAKFAKAITDAGVKLFMHGSGKVQDLLEDWVDIGASAWHAANITNDLRDVQRRFKGRLVVMGGWDYQGSVSKVGASVEELKQEVRRVMNDYGQYGGYILHPILLNERGNSALVGDDRMPEMIEEYDRVKHCLK